jgi:hypothetical protein
VTSSLSKTSNAPQHAWIQGNFSNEFSGYPKDLDYSPNSIGVLENHEQFCSKSVPWLVAEVFAKDKEIYVALHVDFNATGMASLFIGEFFAILSTADGGAQGCFIFGKPEHPCKFGVPGMLPPLGWIDDFAKDPSEKKQTGQTLPPLHHHSVYVASSWMSSSVVVSGIAVLAHCFLHSWM